MRQFFAILKDSFREAVDGFVIYAMLGMSSLLILVALSMSFTAAAPQEGFEKIVRNFSAIVSRTGHTRISFGPVGQYKVSDVQREGSHYKLRLTVDAKSHATINGKPDLSQGDDFRQTVAAWRKPGGKGIEVDTDEGGVEEKNGKGSKRGGRPKVEIASHSATVEDQRAVTTEDMEAFIRNQFDAHAGMDAVVKRVTDGIAEPTYAFDVTTSGGSAVKGWPHTTKIFFGAFTLEDEAPLGAILWTVEDMIINRFGGTFALLVGLIITAFFIPNMLRKGSVDLLISKPIGRARLLIYKYIGGLTFMFLVSAFTVGGIWLVFALRSGYWDPGFLMAIPLLTFTFAILYAVSTLAAVFTRSAIAAMLLSIGFAFFMFVFGQIKATYDDNRAAEPDRLRPAWQAFLVDNGHDLLPRMRGIELMIRRYISEGTMTSTMQRMAVQSAGEPPSAAGTFGVSLVHIAWMLGVSCWWFSKRDY